MNTNPNKINNPESLLTLSQELLRCESITPLDAGCQQLLATRLAKLGFTILDLSATTTTNTLYLAEAISTKPLLLFIGHTDVVPTGPLQQWQHPPFAATVTKNKLLYGRGTADMKCAIAAFVIAIENTFASIKDKLNIGLAITSDEEGPATHGCKLIANYLNDKQQIPQYCLVGEPSCKDFVGDTIKVGRRGSLHAAISIHGQQGHVAYPQLANNAIHITMQPLLELTQQQWDNGNTEFPATTMQISNLHAGVGAKNVIPGELSADINWRFSPEITPEQIKERTTAILQQHKLDFSIDWQVSALPFHSQPGLLRQAITAAITAQTGEEPIISTAGGTSDGRFFAHPHSEILEFGCLNKTIHQINEHISLADLYKMQAIYEQTLLNLARLH